MNKGILGLAITVILLMSIPLSANRIPIDLTEIDVFIREGFNRSWIEKIPDNDDRKWIIVKGKKGNRSLQVRHLGLKGIPKWEKFSSIEKDYTFTYLFPITLDTDDIYKDAIGLYLAQIGQNWEVYFNGSLIKSEMYINDKGRIETRREMRNLLMLLPQRILKEGENILALRIVGDPTIDRTGLFMNRDYIIGPYLSLEKKRSEILTYMLLAVYFFFGIYHFLLFIRRRKELFNLFFTMTTVFLSTYMFMRSNLAFIFISDSAVIKHAEFISIIMGFASLMAFMDLIVRKRMSIFAKIYFVICLLLAILVVPFEREFLPFGQYSIVLMLLYIFIYDIVIPFSMIVVNNIKQSAAEIFFFRIVKGFSKGVFQTIPGNLFIGLTIVVATAIMDVFNAMDGEPVIYSVYGFSLFILGLALIMANRFLNVHNQMEILNVTLEQKVDDRTKKLKMAYEEVEAAMEELEAVNDNLLKSNNDLEDAHRVMMRDMRMAVQVQTSFFPRKAPLNDEWDIDFVFMPVAGVSGDLYDFFVKNDKLLGFGLFDVSGHGIASGLLTLLARSVIFHRFMEKKDKKLNRVIEEINKNLIQEIGNLDSYITGVLFSVGDDYLEYVNAGHPDIVVKRSKTNKAQIIKPKNREFKGHFLGIQSMQDSFNVVNLAINKGDVILLFTDCLNENMNKYKESFGYERILQALNDTAPEASAHDILMHLLDEFYSYVDKSPILDDLTVIVVKKK